MIVGLHGKMGSGKSICSDMICSILKENNIKAEVKSFAKPIYEIVGTIFDAEVEEIKRNKNTLVRPRSFMGLRSYRELLQKVGMNLRDLVHEDIWIDAMFGKENSKILGEWTGLYKWWIIDDLRFINEFDKVAISGGKLIKVKRNVKKNLHPDILNNRSETDLDNLDDDAWDFIIDNNDSIDITRKSLENYIMTIL
tara:strand:- start:1064 stop:1651 length:588 start_codon:yes stop_codon:yes gene_type:complete